MTTWIDRVQFGLTAIIVLCAVFEVAILILVPSWRGVAFSTFAAWLGVRSILGDVRRWQERQ